LTARRFALGPAFLALVWASACGADPEAAAREAIAAAEAGDPRGLRRWVHPSYADGVGGRDAAIEDFAALARRYARRAFEIRALEVRRGASRARAEVVADLDLRLEGGGPTVRLEGPAPLELVRDEGFRVRSGLLTALRDVLALMRRRRAALEANDLGALRDVLHPSYAEGPYDRERLIARVREDLEGAVVRVDVRAWRIELRPDLVHVDEHHRLRVDGRELPPAVGRFTLAPSAGRLRIRAGIRPPPR
jgi:hypothetical protein